MDPFTLVIAAISEEVARAQAEWDRTHAATVSPIARGSSAPFAAMEAVWARGYAASHLSRAKRWLAAANGARAARDHRGAVRIGHDLWNLTGREST